MAGYGHPWWFTYTFDNVLRRLFQNADKIVEPFLGPGDTAVDLGCGMGFFSIAMAKAVGPEGRVVALDLEPKHLEVLRRRADRAGVTDRIETRPGPAEKLDRDGNVDFVIASWMMHEAEDLDEVCRRVSRALRPGGRFLVAEPAWIVWKRRFARIAAAVEAAGLTLTGRPKVGLSRAALFEKRGA